MSGRTIAIGHTPQKSGEVLDLGFLKCIDTNCHRGGWLTSLEIHTGQVWRTNERGELRCRRSVAGTIPFNRLFRLFAEGSDLCLKMTSSLNWSGWSLTRTRSGCGYSTAARSARR